MHYIGDFLKENNLRFEHDAAELQTMNQKFWGIKKFQHQLLESILLCEKILSNYRSQYAKLLVPNYQDMNLMRSSSPSSTNQNQKIPNFSKFLIHVEKEIMSVKKIFENVEFEMYNEESKEQNSAILTRFVLHSLSDTIKKGFSDGFANKLFGAKLTHLWSWVQIAKQDISSKIAEVQTETVGVALLFIKYVEMIDAIEIETKRNDKIMRINLEPDEKWKILFCAALKLLFFILFFCFSFFGI